MMKSILVAIAAMVVLSVAIPAKAADGTMTTDQNIAKSASGPNYGLALIGAGIGAGICVLGGGLGVGAIGGRACESIARQPEAGGRIFTTMIISAALIEGFTFFAIVVCMLGWVTAGRFAPAAQ